MSERHSAAPRLLAGGCHREIEQHRPIVERDVGDDQRQDANDVERDLHRFRRARGVAGERPRYPYSLMSTSEKSIKRNVGTHVRYRDFRYRLELSLGRAWA